MQRNSFCLIVSLALLIFFITFISGYQISSKSSNSLDIQENPLTREKRQLEELDNEEYPTSSAQEAGEEPGFWDRVVKIALKMFNKFIEWLNSS